jgi:hypothetical protein
MARPANALDDEDEDEDEDGDEDEDEDEDEDDTDALRPALRVQPGRSAGAPKPGSGEFPVPSGPAQWP